MRLLLLPLIVCTLICIGLFQASCKKEPLVQTIYVDTIISGNNAPNYYGVPTISIQLYIIKLYVDLVGREPTSAELTTHLQTLVSQHLSANARQQIVQPLLDDTAFYQRHYEITASDFINSTSQAQIESQINQFMFVAYLDSVNGNTQNLPFIYLEIERLNRLKEAPVLLSSEQISINKFYERFLDNYFYDQVNMGVDNFVTAAFEDLFKRPPTASELQQSKSMINGQSSSLFLSDGSSKADFMNIMVQSDAFYEGFARKIYLQFLLREPTSIESFDAMNDLKNSGYNTLIFQLTSSVEYAGF